MIGQNGYNLGAWRGATAYWEFDSSLTADATGNGNTLTNNGTAVSGAGYIGNAVALLGASSQFMSIASGSATAFDPAASFTVRARIYPTLLGATERDIFGKNITTGNQREWLLFYSSAGVYRLSCSANGSSSTSVNSAATPALSGWVDIFAGYDAGAGVIWISTELEPPVVTAFTGPVFASTASLAIGAGQSGTALRFTGSIDTVGFWPRKLSWGEMRFLHQSKLYGTR